MLSRSTVVGFTDFDVSFFSINIQLSYSSVYNKNSLWSYKEHLIWNVIVRRVGWQVCVKYYTRRSYKQYRIIESVKTVFYKNTCALMKIRNISTVVLMKMSTPFMGKVRKSVKNQLFVLTFCKFKVLAYQNFQSSTVLIICVKYLIARNWNLYELISSKRWKNTPKF